MPMRTLAVHPAAVMRLHASPYPVGPGLVRERTETERKAEQASRRTHEPSHRAKTSIWRDNAFVTDRPDVRRGDGLRGSSPRPDAGACAARAAARRAAPPSRCRSPRRTARSLGVDRAATIVTAVLAEAKKHPTWRFNIAVVDANGDLLYFYRMDGAQLGSIGISQGKARTAVRYRREIARVLQRLRDRPPVRGHARSDDRRLARRLPADRERQDHRRPRLQRRHRRSRRDRLRSRRSNTVRRNASGRLRRRRGRASRSSRPCRRSARRSRSS